MNILCLFGHKWHTESSKFIPGTQRIKSIKNADAYVMEIVLKDQLGITVQYCSCQRCGKHKAEEHLGNQTHLFKQEFPSIEYIEKVLNDPNTHHITIDGEDPYKE